MTDLSTTTTTRQARSERDWLDSTGTPIDDEADYGLVESFSYTLKAIPDEPFVLAYKDASEHTRKMLFAFGGQTLCGNIASTTKTKSPREQLDAIRSRFAGMEAGLWVERTTGGGPRYNPDQLALAIATMKHGDSPTPEQIASFRVKIGPDAPKAKARDTAGAEREMDYGQYALTNPKVKAIYDRLTGKVQADDSAL